MNLRALLGVMVLALVVSQNEAGIKEKRLAQFFLLGVALAPRGFVPVPVPQYKNHYGLKQQKLEHIHIHAHSKHEDHGDYHHHGHQYEHHEDHGKKVIVKHETEEPLFEMTLNLGGL
ncbi:uncharacterized protein LOC111268006 isoform X2 [Varroa jacobsoni]|nr:uncharacterized protein LOC111248154 isoform X2 [Varroa destructor]XP_022655730.1 uncharacterized protein LOC111248154 isoform X2 [Varroa destructor]XP_022702405.1 uncharacterized protein LOC111268006 isoform X2 [Varroa jacobsoni]